MHYDPKAIESRWQARWLKERIYEPDLNRAKRPFYNLMMFPYPSAEGLHVGNMYAFIGADIHGRFQRMRGFDVFEPIGLDGFGIHSENYALKINKHPADQVKISEKNFYRQLQMIGNGFAWEERLETYNPAYYKWTQWIFVEMFRRGLAYRRKSPVNWCPSCKTVLADEQVISGECERCGTKVIKKDLEQWFFKITAFAGRLLKNLDVIDWSERIKIAQRNWIGRSEGAEIEFRIQPKARGLGPVGNLESRIRVFTTRPDTLFGVTYMVLGPEHALITSLVSRITNHDDVEAYVQRAKSKTDDERIAEGREKTGVELQGIKAVNPATKEEIPVWVADYVLGHVGTGAIMAVPAHDERDFAFAKKYKLSIKKVIQPPQVVPDIYEPPRSSGISASAFGHLETKFLESECWIGPGKLINSAQFNGGDSKEAKWAITEAVGGKRMVNYRLRDWLISRQRYWGPPIPIIYCRKCWEIRNSKSETLNKSKILNSKLREGIDYAVFGGEEFIIHPVPGKDLPVKLPYIKNFRPTGTDQSPLATVHKFWKVRCPKCKSWARRETDVSDTFLDSAWYYLGYLILGNQKSKIKNQKFTLDSALIERWLPVDMYIGGAEHAVLHLLYVRFLAMAFYDWGLIHFEEPFRQFRAHGLLISSGAKMSKSRGNVVNPDEYVRAYGADALRMYLMFLGPFEQGGDFRDTGIRGITRFLERVWRFMQSRRLETRNPKSEIRNKSQIPNSKLQKREDLYRMVHKTIKKVAGDIEGLQYNTAISALMVLLNAFEAKPNAVAREHISVFLRLLAPFAPHITEELWHSALGEKTSIHRSHWPEADPRHLKEERVTLVVQVNGRVRDRIEMAADAAEAAVRALVLERPKVNEWLAGKPVRKFVYVPGRIVNIVV